MPRTRNRNATRRRPQIDTRGKHERLGLRARLDADNVWRWIGVRPGDEVLTARQVSELVPDRMAG
jgi:hypothetical protein